MPEPWPTDDNAARGRPGGGEPALPVRWASYKRRADDHVGPRRSGSSGAEQRHHSPVPLVTGGLTNERKRRRQEMATAFVSMAGFSGCYGVAIADLCRKVGVSNRAYYQTFSSKEECFVLGFDLLAEPLLERAQAAYDKARGPWAKRLAAGLTQIMTELAADPAYARSCTLESLHAGSDAREHLRAVIVRSQEAFECRAHLAAPAPLGGDPLCSMVVGAILGPMHGYLRADRADRLPELVPGFVSFLTGVAGGRT